MRPDDFQRYQYEKTRTGTVLEWDDARGYGWIRSGEKRLFAHIKDFEGRGRRPVAGEEVEFSEQTDAKGRLCAKRLVFVKSRAGGKMSIGNWILLALLLVIPSLGNLFLPLPVWLVPSVMVIMSLIAVNMYSNDKKQAQAGGWRISEKSLHLTELLGGWPGAFIAQRIFRHKSSKSSYQAKFFVIVLAYQIAAVDVVAGHRLSGWVMVRIAELSETKPL